MIKNSLITKVIDWNSSTMTEANHLGKALMIKPDIFEGVMNQIFTSKNYFSDNPMSSLLFSTKNVMRTNNTEWEWQLRGGSTRPLIVVDRIETSNYPGKIHSEFSLILDEGLFIAGDVITPGTTNKKYQSRIQEDPIKYGNGYLYKLVLVTNDPNDYVPTKYLNNGTRWGKLYSQYEEGAEQSGSTTYSAPIMLTNRMGRLRKKYEVTGDVANTVLAVAIPDSNGKLHKSWIKYAETEYWKQWYREIERSLWYSRKSDKVEGATGRPVITGPGIQQMLEDSHIHYYTHLTSNLIEEYLMDIFYSRVTPNNRKTITAFTGEYGMILFHRAMQQLINKDSATYGITNSNFTPIQKAKSPYHDNSYAVGYQFVEYHMANGLKLKLVHNPLYDDQDINFEIDEVTGRPVESMRFTFLDFGGEGSDSNIKMVEKINGLKFGYTAGLTNPYGFNSGSLMSHEGDYYTMLIQKQFGMHIEDISRCGELILDRN